MGIEDKITRFYNKTKIPEEQEEKFDLKVMNKIYTLQYSRENKYKLEKSKLKIKVATAFSIFFIFFIVIKHLYQGKINEEYIEKEIVYINESKDIKVMIVGDFNNWSPTPMEYDGEKWRIKIKAKKNTIYSYNFIVEDKYINEISKENQILDYFGNKSIVFISY